MESRVNTNSQAPIRVVVVDDSPTVREHLVGILQKASGMHVVGVGKNGEEAVRLTHQLRPDVLTMDVRMPRMDGLEATRQIMREVPTPIVIVTAAGVQSDAALNSRALSAGALMVMHMPGGADQESWVRLVETVRLMARVPVIHHWGRGRNAHSSPAAQPIHTSHVPPAANGPRHTPGSLLSGRKLGAVLSQLEVVGIAASTGGPGVVAELLAALPSNFPLPILLVQHVTNGFCGRLAEWLDGQTALTVRLAQAGDSLQAGRVLVAPDDCHMQVNRLGQVELVQDAPYKGLRPSANYLFHSLARAYGARALGMLLTGMGDDGVNGLLALHRAGGYCLAQDQASCVVYGMPREAVAQQAVDTVLNPQQMLQVLGQIGEVRDRAGRNG